MSHVKFLIIFFHASLYVKTYKKSFEKFSWNALKFCMSHGKQLNFFLQTPWNILQKFAKCIQNDLHGKFSKNYVKPYKKCFATCKTLRNVWASSTRDVTAFQYSLKVKHSELQWILCEVFEFCWDGKAWNLFLMHRVVSKKKHKSPEVYTLI